MTAVCPNDLRSVTSHFARQGDFVSAERCGSGHCVGTTSSLEGHS